MALEPIRRNSYAQPDRSETQESVATAVENNPELFIERYNNDPRSYAGRYVCSDLFKETFPEYNASRESRDRYNAPVHNSAAVLASEQFRRVIHDTTEPARDSAVFLTGIPGAGKTTFALASEQLPPDTRVVFEGQLANPATTIPKIQEAIDAGLKPTILVVHTPAERALHNTLQRFQREGRGASLHVMAQIQSELPDGLQAVHDHFGNAVNLVVIDRRDTMITEHRGWEHLPELASEGSYDTIKQRLTHALEQHRDAGTIDDAGYNQALGRALPQLARSMDSERHRPAEQSDNPLPPGLLKDQSTQTKVEQHGSLRFWHEQTPEHFIKHAAGTLLPPDLVSSKRNLTAQRAVSRGTGDDAGHLIGHQFGGPEIPSNLSLQHYAQNQGGGTYWDLERKWADQLRHNIGVSVHVREMTRAGEDRPYHRHVEWVETHPNGHTERGSLDFMNAESYKTRAARGEAISTLGTPAKVIDFRAYVEQREQTQPGASWKEGAQPPTSLELASGEANQNEIDAPPLTSTEHATPFHEVFMPDFEHSQPYYPPTTSIPTEKTEAELHRDEVNAAPGEDSIFRNDKEEQRNDPHYKQWIKDEGVDAAQSKFYGESETQKQLTQETQDEADKDNDYDLGERNRESIAVRLTEDQTKLLLSAEYPNDGRAQTTALAAIYSGEDEINIMDENVQLDYSEDEQTFFAILESSEKPALDAKLTLLQQERLRDYTEREKAQDPRQKERSHERQHER